MENQHDEFELVPMSPIRRLERRIDQIETTTGGADAKSVLAEMFDIIKMNQMLVDELAKANDALRIELSRLPGRLEELIDRMTELLTYIKASAAEESSPSASFKPLAEKFDLLIEENKRVVESNQSMLLALEDIDKKLRRSTMPMSPQPVRVLPPPQRPIQ
ncbi:MAG TPA: hypothetical protein VJ343_02205 [archaeon]|nr:hypothetical protein [archaeon]